MKEKRIYKIASLFSGCGGMDLGAEGDFSFLEKKYRQHPVEIVYAMDFDKHICDVYDANFSRKIDVCDIRLLRSDKIPNHDILTGGFPCQSFSVVAQNPKRLGYKDEKGKLFFEMCRILREKKPAVFVGENVKGLLSANNGDAFPLVLKEFTNAGYYIKYQVLNASRFGVPQKRERVFIVGFRDREAYDRFKFPDPVNKEGAVPLSAVVMQEKEVDEKFYFSEKAINGMSSTKHSKSMNKGRIQKLHQPSNTVGAHLAKVSLNSTDPVLSINGRYRMFTPREVARIQSFPDSFVLSGSKTTNYKALGNAVPPVVMWYVTRNIMWALERKN